MSNPPTGPDDPIAQLLADGYDIVLLNGHLVVRQIPYLGPTGLRSDGKFVLPVDDSGDVVTDASGDHRIWFAGEEPTRRTRNGSRKRQSARHRQRGHRQVHAVLQAAQRQLRQLV